jgi:hypothetical protein
LKRPGKDVSRETSQNDKSEAGAPRLNPIMVVERLPSLLLAPWWLVTLEQKEQLVD